MSEGFSDPTTAGDVLAIPAIQSPNFSLAGQTGWAIMLDGTAYFFSVTAEGTITATTFSGADFNIDSAGAFFYNGAPANGTLLISIASSAGTDPYANPYAYGVSSNSVNVTDSFGNRWQFTTNTVAAVEYLTVVTPTGGQFYVTESGVVIAAEPGSAATPEPWHDLRPLANSFSYAGAGFFPPQYHIDATGQVQALGGVTLPAAYNSTTFATIAAGWRPAQNVYIPLTVISNAGAAPANSASPVLEVTTAGVMQFHNLPTGLAGTNVTFSGFYPVGSSPITS